MPVFFLLVTTSLLFCFYCYTLALNGPFVLDDDSNFYGLRFVHNLADAFIYSTTGPAGERWLSYLSFTLPQEVSAWKNSDAFPFKLINLIIHGINGLLVFGCLRQLFLLKNLPYLSPLVWSAGITALWLAHPLHVNTVLYSVQRMTLLSGTAVLLGVYYHLAYIHRHSQQIAGWQSWFIYSVIIALITLIGILCKESAILLPLYIFTCYAFLPQRPFSRWQMAFTLLAPYLLLVIYLVVQQKLGYGNRLFTMEERLLSQVVILPEYVLKIALPSANSFSLFYDDFVTVKSVADTRFLLSALFGLLFIGIARYGKHTIPGLWFGCLWFLAGHALESTIIPLELYFDHRNYLPSLGILIIMASAVGYLLATAKKHSIVVLLLILVIAIAGKNMALLKEETGYWQSNDALAEAQFIKHPDSMRANQYYIETLINQGHYHNAVNMIGHLHQKFGIYPSNAIFQVGLACILQADANINHTALIDDLKTIRWDIRVSSAMSFLMDLAKKRACPSLTWETFDLYTNSLLANPAQRKHYHNLVFLLVSSHMHRNDHVAALQSSLRLAKRFKSPQFQFLQMHLSISTNNLPVAESVFAEISAFDKPKKILYKNEIKNIGLALDRLRNENKN
jgi:protein O-mannosyl-transferase